MLTYEPSPFGNRIKQLRQQKGWSIAFLAEKSRVSYTSIERLERGAVQDMMGERICRLADALEVSTDYLLGRDEHRINGHLMTQEAVVAYGNQFHVPINR